MKHPVAKKSPAEEKPGGDGTGDTDLSAEMTYRCLFNTIHLAVSLQDPEGRFLEVNDAKTAMYGYTREDFIGKTPEFLAAPGLNDFTEIAQKTGQALSGEPQQMEFWGSRRNGEVFCSDVRFYKGTCSGRDVLVSVSTDITGQKEAEKACRESEERYRHLLEAITDYVFTVRVQDGHAVETLHGPGCEAVTGYPARDFSRDPGLWLRMVVEEDRPSVVSQAERLLAGEPAFSLEHRIMHKDGQVRWVTNTLVPRYDPAGRLVAYDGLIQDITDRKVVELAFLQSEAQLNAIIRASPIPMFVINNRHRVIAWNRALENTSGIRSSEVLGTDQHWRAFYPAPRSCLSDLLADRADDRIPGLYPGKFKKSDILEGAYEVTDFFPAMGTGGKWLHFIAAPITGSDGAVIGSVETLEDITELVKAQEELKESEERYSSLFSHNYSVSLIIDPDTAMIVDANDAAARYYGYPREKLLTLGIHDLNRLPRNIVVRNLTRAKDEKEKHFLSTHYLADGDKREVEIYSGPIRIQGRTHFYSIIHDITDRKKAEENLRDSENKFATVFQSSPVALTLVSVDEGVFVDVNEAFVRNSGYSRDDVIGKTPDSVGLFTNQDEYQRMRLALRQQQSAASVEMTCRTKTGADRTCLFSSALIVMGKKPYILSTIQDITDRKQAELALRESEERYRTLIDQLPDYVIVHRNGTLLYVNRTAAASTGYDADALIGRPLSDFIAPEHLEKVRDAIIRRMAGEDIPAYEMRFAVQDGTYRTILVHGAAISFEGRPASLNVLTDITLIKQAEEKIRHANEELEKRVTERTDALVRTNDQLISEIAARNRAEEEITRSLEEKDLLLREIHHRVKNNLQIIASLLKLQSRHISDPNVLEAIQSSQSRIRAMALVHERIYRSHNIAEINIREYLTYLTKQIFQFYNIQQHLITLSVTMEDIMADIDTVTPLGLIMNELVSNSLKHAFPEGRNGSISIECSLQQDGSLRFIYHDTGVGMPAGLDWKTAESLGLRLVNNLVDQLNGTIDLGPGEGTTFIIRIRKNPSGEK
jgi:PAS domain S-box-containing protein